MLLFCLVLVAVLLGRLELLAASFLAAAVFLLSSAWEAELSHLQILSIMAFAFSIPAAALICGLLLDRFCGIRSAGTSFSKLGALLATTAMLVVAPIEQQLYNLSTAIELNDLTEASAVIISLASSVLFCGCVSAFVLITAVLLFEFSAQYLLHLFGLQKRCPISLEGLRIVLVFTLLTWSLHLIVGLFSAELSPVSFLSG